MQQKVNLKNLLPLNESVLYVLLSLFKPRQLEQLRSKLEGISNKRIRLTAEQLESILKKLLALHLIVRVASSHNTVPPSTRYIISPLGKEVVQLEQQRIKQLYSDIEKALHTDTAAKSPSGNQKH